MVVVSMSNSKILNVVHCLWWKYDMSFLFGAKCSETTCNTNIFLLKNFNYNSSKPYDNLEYLPMKMGNLYKIYSSLSLEIWELFLKYGFRSEVFDIVFCLTFSFYILWWLVIRMRPRNFNLYKICCVFFWKICKEKDMSTYQNIFQARWGYAWKISHVDLHSNCFSKMWNHMNLK